MPSNIDNYSPNCNHGKPPSRRPQSGGIFFRLDPGKTWFRLISPSYPNAIILSARSLQGFVEHSEGEALQEQNHIGGHTCLIIQVIFLNKLVIAP